jgi:hypothetical protein
MISISYTAPPRKKESYCQLFKHLPFSKDKTTTTTTTNTTQQKANPKPAFLPSFLPSFRNTSTKLHSNKAITGSIKQAPNLSCKGSASEEGSEARRARARNLHQNKAKRSCRKGSIHSMNWSGVGKTTTTTSVTIVARCEQIRNTLLEEFGIHFIANIMI